MKRLINCWELATFFLFTANALMACSDDGPMEEMTEEVPTPPSGEENNGAGNNSDNNNETMERNITVSVNGTAFAATLAANDAARAFAAMLPLTLDMNELNGNEKYHYLSENLPTDSHRPGTIRSGDLMLYGSNCIVLFYETFQSAYSYTPIGRLDNPSGLAAALGGGNVNVTFEMNND